MSVVPALVVAEAASAVGTLGAVVSRALWVTVTVVPDDVQLPTLDDTANEAVIEPTVVAEI
ncbi:hypothetical protein GCM10022381_24680 [Leifsonia kafniensis]|uniref:Secreted protein n=1 Tax=Leifsonia kafniensis TaxID=475957 RepID=A0ABP7KNG5_9MICO